MTRTQGSRPERPTDATSDGATVADGVDVVLAAILDAGDDVTAVDREREHRERNSRSQTKDHDDEGARFREQVVDVRPKLAPGAMLTLSQLAAEAIMAFTEEVRRSSSRTLPRTFGISTINCICHEQRPRCMMS